MTKQEIMVAAVRAEFPDAVFMGWISNYYKKELHFLPHPHSNERYVVVIYLDNAPIIMPEF